VITLRAMTPTEYEAWLDTSTDEYALEKVKAGNWPADDAKARALAEYAGYLPQGTATAGHHLFTIADAEDRAVGMIWIATDVHKTPGRCWIYDLRVDEHQRRRGHARAAMLAIEAVAREHGQTVIGLHVFGHNTGARALYESLGYGVTNVNMAKPLV